MTETTLLINEEGKTRDGYLNHTPVYYYKKYKKEEKLKQSPIRDYKLYKEILEFLFTRIWFYMIRHLWKFTPPLNFGRFYIAESFNSSGKYINWQESRKQGKKVYSYNFHTRGRKFYLKWDKFLANVSHIRMYNFKTYRGSEEELIGNRGLKAYIKQCAENPEVPDFRGHLI